VTASALGISDIGPSQGYAALMDMGMQKGTATVVSFLNGEASIYLSTGGGMIGGGQQPTVNRAAKDFVRIASSGLSGMKHDSDMRLPEPGQVFFYVLTSEGVFSASASDAELASGSSALTPIYAAAQDVISAYRELKTR
jgi:hypothetical protein